MAGGAEIDDAQAGMPKSARAIRRRPNPAVVRAAMEMPDTIALIASRLDGPTSSVRRLCRTCSNPSRCHNIHGSFVYTHFPRLL